MAEAKRALEILSAEPDARRIAEMRREAEIARRLDRGEAFAEGRLEMLRRNIEQFCAAFGIELDDTRRAVLHSLDLTALDALFVQLMQQRAWPLESIRAEQPPG